MTNTTLTLSHPLPLGELLALTRGMIGLDQTAMGKRVGASRPTISAWERGTREPSFSQVETWAKLTGQPLSVFAEALNAETAPADAGAVSDVVRLKGLEPLTFWFVAWLERRRFWTRERRDALASLDVRSR